MTAHVEYCWCHGLATAKTRCPLAKEKGEHANSLAKQLRDGRLKKTFEEQIEIDVATNLVALEERICAEHLACIDSLISECFGNEHTNDYMLQLLAGMDEMADRRLSRAPYSLVSIVNESSYDIQLEAANMFFAESFRQGGGQQPVCIRSRYNPFVSLTLLH